jgi:hypothetical protein
MAFNFLMQLAVSNLIAAEGLSGSVVELGNQRFRSHPDILGRCSEILGANLAPFYDNTWEFFSDVGFPTYQAIDLNSELKAIPMNLNKVLKTEYGYEEKFSLVTNNGTGEHIFNQATVFENCHNLCSLNGLMLHVLPLTPWLNHGFFNFNPILFRDLAAANSYEVSMLWIGRQNGSLYFDLGSSKNYQEAFFEQKRPHNPTSLLEDAVLKLMLEDGTIRHNVAIVCGLKKTSDSIFTPPIQGRYVGDVRSEEIKREISAGNQDNRQANHSYDYLKDS